MPPGETALRDGLAIGPPVPAERNSPIQRVLLIVQSTKFGGMETHSLALAGELMQRGVAVAAVLPAESECNEFAARFAAADAVVERIATDAREGRRAQAHGLIALRRFMRAWHPDVVHLHTGGTTGGAAVVAIARACGATTIITEHDVPAPDASRKARIARRAIDRLAHAVVAVSNRNVRERRARLGFAPRPAHNAVIVNGVPVASVPLDVRAANRACVRGGLGVAADAVLLGCVVRLAEGKGLDTLLRAFAILRGRQPCDLALVGDGPLRAELEALAAELGVHDAVRFAGQQSDPTPYYDALDLFVLAVPAGSGSIALREAMARGLPAVITHWNPEEPVIPGVTGFDAPPNDPAGLAAVLEWLVEDAALRARMSTAAVAEMQAHHSVRRMTDDLLELYAAARTAAPRRLRPFDGADPATGPQPAASPPAMGGAVVPSTGPHPPAPSPW